jgi:hypothetical protein
VSVVVVVVVVVSLMSERLELLFFCLSFAVFLSCL